jgi:hypothetical protein
VEEDSIGSSVVVLVVATVGFEGDIIVMRTPLRRSLRALS